MATYDKEILGTPLITQYSKAPELNVSYIFKLRPEELSLFFKQEHLRLPDNKGEKRESLVILEKVGMMEGLLQALKTETDTGIIGDRKDLNRRMNFFGKNFKRLPQLKKYFTILMEQFNDYVIKVLIVAGILSILVNLTDGYEWLEGVSILFAVILITTFQAATEQMKEKQLLKLNDAVLNEEVKVIRGQNGLPQTQKVNEVVVGDIVVIEAGMKVPADCILINGLDVTVDECIYFEDRETIVEKHCSLGSIDYNNHTENPDPFLLTGSIVMSGSGVAVACAVGNLSRIEVIDAQKQAEHEEESFTPLQKKLENIANQLGKWGYTVGFLVFVSCMIFYLLKCLFNGDAQLVDSDTLSTLLDNFTIAVAVIIVAVPEGLPLSVSIAMAFSVDILKNEHLLIKAVEALENMGSITEICTGKTATLTQNKLNVACFYTADQMIQNKDKDTFRTCGISQDISKMIIDAIVFNNEAHVAMSEDGLYVPEGGNGIEIGMLNFLADNDQSIYDLYQNRQRNCIVETNIPFSPERKRQVVAIRNETQDPNFVKVIVKGAPEYILPMCTQVLNSQSRIVDLTKHKNEEILDVEIRGKCCRKGLKTIVYAFKHMDIDDWNNLKEMNNQFLREEDRLVLEQDLTFLASFGLNDELREGVPEVVDKLFQGGINVRMVSGDNLLTAIEAAKNSRILQPEEERIDKVCMEGRDFRDLVGGVKKVQDSQGNVKWQVMNLPNFKAIAQRLKVLARSTPEDKFTLVVGLKELGASVAVTAEGLSDCRALKQANVGFCMGLAGVQAAKESSDIILLDDNFKSVFRACQWGRNIYDNVRKFLTFQMTVNIVTLFMVLLSGATLGDTPFNVIQLLWINMVMDTLAAVALATEPPHPTELKQQRIKKQDRVVLNSMWRSILGQSIYQILVLTVFLYFGPMIFDIEYDLINFPYYITGSSEISGEVTSRTIHYTFLFQTFMLMNLFNQFNCRKLGAKEFNIFSNFFNNFTFIFVVVFEFVATFAIVNLGGVIFRTTPLPFTMFYTSIILGVGSLIVGAALKATPEHLLDKIKLQLDEEGVQDEKGLFARFQKWIMGGIKGDDERLLG